MARTAQQLGLAASAALLLGASSTAQEPAGIALSRLVPALQQKYSAINDFSAGFVHTYEGGVLRKKLTERGELLVKKPGRMRWTYSAPEEKVFVSDGERLYSYVPADRQVVVSAMPQGDEASTPILFLVGKGNLARDFDAFPAAVEGAPAGSVSVRLTPKRPQREYAWLTLVVDARNLSLRMLQSADAQGGVSTFTFLDLKENVGIPDGRFVFKIPRGTDVITQ